MRRAIVAVVVLAAASVAHGTDKPIGAAKLVLTRSASGTEKLTFVSKDPGFLFPAIGGADDPAAAGATVTIVSPLEAPVPFAVPAGTGTPGWRTTDRATLDAYKYTNGAAPTGSAVRSLVLREKRTIKIVARDTGVALSAAQGSLGIRLTTGGLRNCARFVGQSVVVDEPGRFVGRGAIATAAADCSDGALGAPSTTSTSTTTTTTLPPVCGDGVLDAGEQCDGSGDTCGFGPGGFAGCFPPGSPGECLCCGNTQCYEGGFGETFPCCPGLSCARFMPPIPGQGFGLGVCAAVCAPTGTTCDTLPCCSGACAPLAPNFPPSCQ